MSKDKRFIVSTKGNEGNARTNTIEFNFRRKELSDIRVRRAIAHAINVPFFIDNFLGDFAKLGTGPIPSTSTDFYPGANTPQYPYDKAKAAALLDEAGFKAGRGGTRFSLKLLPAPWGEDISLWSTFIQQSLGEIGIPVEIVRNDGGGFLKQVYDEHAFDLATGWHQYRNDPAVSTTVWYRSGQPKGAPWTNQWGWEDKTVDKTIDDAADRSRSGQAQGALCPVRQGSEHGAAGLDADRADFRHRDHGEGAQSLQYPALGFDELARSLAFGLTLYPPR